MSKKRGKMAPPPVRPTRKSPSAVDSAYTDEYVEGDSDAGRSSLSPFDDVLAELEQEGEGGPKDEAVRPTLLQTLGAPKIYLMRGGVGGNRRERVRIGLYLLILGIVLGVLTGIGVVYLIDSKSSAANDSLIITSSPTSSSTSMTSAPTAYPTDFPTTPSPTKLGETASPTKFPTKNPTKFPTKNPTPKPTKNPTKFPTKNPTKNPTRFPTKNPTKAPTRATNSNPCQTALDSTYRFCESPTFLRNCVSNNQGGFVVGTETEDCSQKTGDRKFCKCTSGRPFTFTYGCVQSKNVDDPAVCDLV